MDGPGFNSTTGMPQHPAVGKFNPYGYEPKEYVSIIFLVLFSLSGLLHIGQSVYYKMWFMLPTAVLAAFLEILGWAARLWSVLTSLDKIFTPYKMQITTTIIAPTPLLAANFIILGSIILALGPQYSRIPPRLYVILFTSCDLIALIVQGIGGGIAAVKAESGDPTTGGNIMLGGIAFQMFTITAYVLCASEFLFRFTKNLPLRSTPTLESEKRGRVKMPTKIKVMIGALSLSTVLLFIRAVYRLIELADGWTGRIIRTELYFDVLDGAMIVLAMWTVNFIHPGMFLPTTQERVKGSASRESDV